MSSPEGNEPYHSLKDDITYQIVKENFKRTQFVSSDYLITTNSKRDLKAIDKNAKLAKAAFRREHTALVSKLEALQEKKQELGLAVSPRQRSDSSLSRRRNSASFVEKSSSTSPVATPSSQFSQPSDICDPTGVEDSLNALLIANMPANQADDTSPQDGSPSTSSSASQTPTLPPSLTKPPTSFKEARRMSHEIQAQTCKLALQKLETIVRGSQRRATIASGATPINLLPPSRAMKSRSFDNV